MSPRSIRVVFNTNKMWSNQIQKQFYLTDGLNIGFNKIYKLTMNIAVNNKITWLSMPNFFYWTGGPFKGDFVKLHNYKLN